VEAGLRRFADGCATSPVGFIEGWFVEPEFRRQGIGKRLVTAAEDWAKSRGCSEMASDSLLENVDASEAHRHLGYEEVERAVRFRKDL
jgi:aminoglycoside 6'-N-acetyltransferase I